MDLQTEAKNTIRRIDPAPEFWGWIEDYEGIEEFFVPIKIGSGGCISSACVHWTHAPEAPMYKLVPRENVQLSLLYSDSRESYYMVDNRWVMKIIHRLGRHDKLEFIHNLDYLPLGVVERLSE